MAHPRNRRELVSAMMYLKTAVTYSNSTQRAFVYISGL
jgi:hypothetical protein